MAENYIITQADVQSVQALESTLATNLIAHANASLSKAHGLEFMALPSPFIDSGGNDVSVYRNSAGDVVGTQQMRITDPSSLASFYVPLNSSALPGQTLITGISASALANAGAQTPSAWVTELPGNVQTNLFAANSQLLLPHSRLAHWEAHTAGVYAVLPQNTYDSAGNLVANNVARIAFNGEELLVPCSDRLGGPGIAPRIIDISPRLYHVNSAAGQTYTPIVTGTQPCTYAWYHSTGADSGPPVAWAYITPTVGSATTPIVFGISGQYLQPLNVSYDPAVGILTVVSGGGGGHGVVGWFRLVVTNSGGTTDVYYGTTGYAMTYWVNGYPTD